ncbi:MAG: hypothetical protein E7135_03515 [Rikenellaceae bacterium]|nr:hypothetical protein [Rikenellaceae bacterium]
MRPIFSLLCLVLLFASCEKDPGISTFPVDETEVVLDWDSDELTINFDLSSYMYDKVDYHITLENGANGWLTYKSNTMTSITFAVKNNVHHYDRSAVILVKNDAYPDFTQVRVTQKCRGEQMLNIDVSDITTTSFNVQVTSKDENMEIFTYIRHLGYGVSIEDRPFDDLIEDGHGFVSSYADPYIFEALRGGVDVKQYMVEMGVCSTGHYEREVHFAVPNGGYCIFTVGVEFYEDESGRPKIKAVTPVYNLYLNTEHTPIREDIKLNAKVDIDPVYSSDALLSIECDEDSNLRYRYLIVNPNNYEVFVEDQSIEEIYEFFSYRWHIDYNYASADGAESLEAFLEESTFAKSFKDERLHLNANTEYYIVAYALDVVDGRIQMVSYPEIVKFTTGMCSMTDISFEMTQNEIHGRMVDFTITPSDDMGGYYVTVMSKEAYESWDSSLLHQRLVDEGWYRGDICYGESNHEFRFLNPETDYCVVCVGVHGGVATTEDITMFPITTPAPTEPKCRVTGFDCYGPFYAGALNDYDHTKYHMNDSWVSLYMSGYCAVGVDIYVEGEVSQLYATFLSDDDTVGCDDNQIISMLQSQACKPKIYYYCKQNIAFHYYIVAMDEDGNIDLYKSPDGYYFTEEDYITDEASIAELAKFYDEVMAQQEGTRSTTEPTTNAMQSDAPCIAVIH